MVAWLRGPGRDPEADGRGVRAPRVFFPGVPPRRLRSSAHRLELCNSRTSGKVLQWMPQAFSVKGAGTQQGIHFMKVVTFRFLTKTATNLGERWIWEQAEVGLTFLLNSYGI